MFEKMEECPNCGESGSKWIYDGQVCKTCHYPNDKPTYNDLRQRVEELEGENEILKNVLPDTKKLFDNEASKAMFTYLQTNEDAFTSLLEQGANILEQYREQENKIERLEVALREVSKEAVFLWNHAEHAAPPNTIGPPMWLVDCRDRITKARAALEE